MRASTIVLAALAFGCCGAPVMARTTAGVAACPHSSTIITSQAGGIRIGTPRHEQTIVVAGLDRRSVADSNHPLADKADGGALSGRSAAGAGN